MLFIARFAFTFLAFLWSGLALVAQNDSIVIIPKIQKGEVLKLEMTKKKYKDTDDEVRKKMYSLSEAELKCVDIKKTEIIWEFKINKVELKGLSDADTSMIDPLIKPFLNSATQIMFRFSTDREGTYTDLLNYSDVVKKINSSTEKIVDYILANNPSMVNMQKNEKKEYRSSLLSIMKNTTSTKEAVAGMYMKEIQLYLYVNGLHMEEKDTLTQEIEFPITFGNTPFAGKEVFYMSKNTDHEIILNSNVVIDPKSYQQAMLEYYKVLTKSLKDSKITAKDISMDLSRDYEFVWDKSSSKITSASITQKNSVKVEGKDAKSNGSFEQTTVRLVK